MKIYGTIWADNETLPLANITVVGQPSLYAVADGNGDFEIDSPLITPSTKIRISFMGYGTQEMSASEVTGKSITLETVAEQLDAVIIGVKPKPVETPAPQSTDNKVLLHLKKNKTPYMMLGCVLLIAASTIIVKKSST